MTMPRETGAEKAAEVCANCGASVGVVESEYGSTSAATCQKCYPVASTEKAADNSGRLTPRELGSGVASHDLANEGSQGGDI